MKKGFCFRADKLLEDHVEKTLKKKAGKLNEDQIKELQTMSAKADSYS